MAYNVADIVRMVQEKDKTTNLTEKKIREKLWEIFDSFGVERTVFLKDGAYAFPDESADFLVSLILDYTSPEMKAVRKDDFVSAGFEYVFDIIKNFHEMLRIAIPDKEKRGKALGQMYSKARLESVMGRETLERHFGHVLELFERDTVDKGEINRLEAGTELHRQIDVEEDFRFFKSDDPMIVDDRIAFFTMMMDDYKALLDRHIGIYKYFCQMRWSDMNETSDDTFTDEELLEQEAEVYDWLVFLAHLRRNETYNQLLVQRAEIVESNEFARNKKDDLKRLDTEIKIMKAKIEVELFGRTRNWMEPDPIDYSKLKSTDEILEAAIKKYEAVGYTTEMDWDED